MVTAEMYKDLSGVRMILANHGNHASKKLLKYNVEVGIPSKNYMTIIIYIIFINLDPNLDIH